MSIFPVVSKTVFIIYIRHGTVLKLEIQVSWQQQAVVNINNKRDQESAAVTCVLTVWEIGIETVSNIQIDMCQ